MGRAVAQGTVKVLFLDDDEERQEAFRKAYKGPEIVQARTAQEAIVFLNQEPFDQVFLDHDLSVDDIMCAPGDPDALCPTGMDVVDHILTMEIPPPSVWVHTMNTPAAYEMEKRLCSHPFNQKPPSLLGERMLVVRLPFPSLMDLVKKHKP